jgi:hypothetical protein
LATLQPPGRSARPHPQREVRHVLADAVHGAPLVVLGGAALLVRSVEAVDLDGQPIGGHRLGSSEDGCLFLDGWG